MPFPNGLAGQTTAMDSTATTALGVVDNVNQYMTRLQPVVDAQRAHWQGTALPIFEAKHEEWRQASIRFTTELTRLSDATKTSGAGYQGANDESTAAMNATQAGAPFGGALSGQLA